MISKLNNLLKPVENFIISHKKIIGIIILFFGIFAILLIQSYKLSLIGAKISLGLLWLILWIPIFSRVFGIKIFTALSGLRQELGVLMGIFALVHFIGIWPMLPFYLKSSPILFALGIIPQVIILLMTITSNSFAREKMGKYWKKLHRLIYIALPIILAQIALATGGISLKNGITFTNKFVIIPWIILIIYFIFKIFEWKNIKLYKEEKVSYPKGQKFLCVPCGYIYDPVIGDEKDGIPAGTEFVDIPDSWRCPDCGVTKADFIPYNEGEKSLAEPLKIIEKIFLNPTTIELILEAPKNKNSKIGQFATFEYSDENGTFCRQYSVSCEENGKIHFLIKLKENGRGAKILQKISKGENMNFIGFFGDFILQENDNQKIFIATGTGLAPIYRMMKNSSKNSKKLYFSVSTKDEIFYKNELDQIENLENFYHISREKVDGFYEGRVKIENIFIDKNAEYYLCGSPRMVEEVVENLKNSGCEKIYFEQFA